MTKWETFIPYKELSTAEDLAYVFLRWIIAEYVLSQELFSDRDKLFISRFWRALIAQLNIKYKLFTTYYP